MTKKKILVIDDEPSIRFLLNEFLTDIGYECIEAERAIKGIEILKREQIDLIILDIQLPQMNGLEAIQKIREIDKEVPVFMLTAFSNMKSVVENLDVNIQEFIPKPFDIYQLEIKIKAQLGD